MKKIASLSVYAAALALFAVSGGITEALAQVKAGTARVTAAGEGSRYSTTANVWLPLKTGDSLPEGAVIATAGAHTDIRLDGSVIRLQRNTTVKLDKLAGGSAAGVRVIDTQLNLADGRVSANVRKLAAGARYEVKTPGGVAGIRGTKLDTQTMVINGKRITIYTAVEGTVDVAETTPAGVITVVLNQGESFVTGDVAVGDVVTIPGFGTVTITGQPMLTPAGWVIPFAGITPEVGTTTEISNDPETVTSPIAPGSSSEGSSGTDNGTFVSEGA